MRFTDEQIEAAIDQVCEKTINEREWAHTVNLMPEWKKAEDGIISSSNLSTVVIQRLNALKDKFDEDTQADEIYELDNAIDEFEMAGDDVDQFDYAMSLLYDWADENDVWVKTF